MGFRSGIEIERRWSCRRCGVELTAGKPPKQCPSCLVTREEVGCAPGTRAFKRVDE